MTTPSAFDVMVKPRGAICNLDCAYCYYLSKEQLYPDRHSRMSTKVLESYTRQYIEAQRVPEVTFGWQGGEPTLMGLDFFRHAVELQEKFRRPGMRIVNTLQTNGTLLDEEWCHFLREHNFLIGISIDGPREVHDAYRVDRAGQPTWERVMHGLSLLKEHGVEYNILTCVHAANAEHPLDVYRFLRDEVKAKFIQFIPIVERNSETQVTNRSVAARAYGRFLTAIFDEWVRRDVGQIFVQIFDAALAAWLEQPPGVCVFNKTCGTGLVMEYNGDLYACDHFVEPQYLLGNILNIPLIEMVGSAQQRRFGLAKRDALPATCRQCEVRFVCNGGCPKNRILLTESGKPELNYLCEGYRAFFSHIKQPMEFMAGELRARRPPANIMLHLAQEEEQLQRRFASAGRNEPCPCGSGRKFKQCHGRKNSQSRPTK